MKNRASTVGIFVTVFVGSTALVASLRAQGNQGDQGDLRQGGQSLTAESLQKALDELGYGPRKLGNGYLISIKKDTWTYNMQFTISEDFSRLDVKANLGVIDRSEKITSAQWMSLMVANGNIGPSCFYFDKQAKKLYMHRVLDNRAITSAYIRQQTDEFCANIRETSTTWSFKK